MSFSDEENKLIEDEETKAEEEIKAKFKSFFSEEELKASEAEYKEIESDAGSKQKRQDPEDVFFDDKNKQSHSLSEKNSNKNQNRKKQRIYGPGYSMSGHKIMTDSDNIYDPLKNNGSKSFYTLPKGVHIFSQDSIPKASNDLTRACRINSQRKVKSRIRKLEKAGADGRKESSKRSDVSVFSKEARGEEYPTAYYFNGKAEPEKIVASGRVNPNTARISRETIEKLLKESEASESEIKRDEIKMLEAGRRAKEKISGATVGRTQAKKRASSGKKKSRQRVRQAQIKSVDNSKKTVRARARAYQRGKKASPGKIVARLILLAVFIALCVFGFLAAKIVFDDTPMNPNDMSKIVFTVDDNTTDDDVAAFLFRNNMVENEMIYKIRAKIFDADYVNGSYELSPSFSTEKIINMLSGFDYSSGG